VVEAAEAAEAAEAVAVGAVIRTARRSDVWRGGNLREAAPAPAGIPNRNTIPRLVSAPPAARC